ncbi:MAG: cysteine desulfurase family protein [Roseimicrobium sp.]
MSVYFDHNATTPLHPAAREAWLAASERFWHNPSSLYQEAAATRRRLEAAREELGELLGCGPERIVFTSGATESNNALFRVLSVRLPQDKPVLSSGMEHPSVATPLRHWFPGRIREINALPDTQLDWGNFEHQVHEHAPSLVTVMAASNESGTLAPWVQLAEYCQAAGVPFHTDASQWIGKLPTRNLGQCAYVSGSAHKFGGPKGCGFLILSHEDEAVSLQLGGHQENGRRAGTENYPAIAAMVAALVARTPQLDACSREQSLWRDAFTDAVCHAIPGTRLVAAHAPRLWNTAMLLMPGHDNRKWLARLSQAGFAISTGSACSKGDGSAQVLQAIGTAPEDMRRALRISGGWESTAEDWASLATAIHTVWRQLES